MTVRHHGMFEIHGADVYAWTRSWGLLPFSRPCSRCGMPLCTTIPIASRRLRGLAAPPCACGSDDAPYLFVAIDGSLDWRR